MQRLKPATVARTVVESCQTTIDDFNDHTIEDEEPMTDRLFGSIRNALDGSMIAGLIWKARTLRTGRGSAAEEKRHGADVLGVLSIALHDYKTTKGFLLQAKIIEPHKFPSKGEWSRFQGQCQVMLDRTCDAFAVVYSRENGIRFIPATTILEIEKNQVFEVGSRSLFGFFKAHVKCEIGDRRLNRPTIEMLDELPSKLDFVPFEFGANVALAMKVSDEADSA